MITKFETKARKEKTGKWTAGKGMNDYPDAQAGGDLRWQTEIAEPNIKPQRGATLVEKNKEIIVQPQRGAAWLRSLKPKQER